MNGKDYEPPFHGGVDYDNEGTMDTNLDRQNTDEIPRRHPNLTRTGLGRPKGALNKTTIAVKAALAQAFEDIGGVERLAQFAKEQPGEFYKLWVKMLPQEIGAADGGGVSVQIIRLSDAE